MSERLRYDNAEERVFGGLYSLQYGLLETATDKMVQDFLASRWEQKRTGELTWIPNDFGAESGVSARLWWQGQQIFLLDHEFSSRVTTLYYAQKPGCISYEPNDFEQAVADAEEIARNYVHPSNI